MEAFAVERHLVSRVSVLRRFVDRSFVEADSNDIGKSMSKSQWNYPRKAGKVGRKLVAASQNDLAGSATTILGIEMIEELKPCPFCGTVPKLVEMGDIIGIECGGDCDKTGLCVAFAPHKRDTAIAAWNRRAALAPAQPIYQVQQRDGFWLDVSEHIYMVTPPTARRLSDAAPSPSGWISVKDRRPENDQTVAFVVKADRESPNWHLNGHVLGGTYHENSGFSTPGVGHRASHWMPLPAAPLLPKETHDGTAQ
ncbi:Lar family restriction alleviation protein [Caballeronia sp. LZ043]|uniref:Lar family restriction alleviation protein n=1 Tax=Caballeronia sp. LZ043 TaxID=3038569 RepID=UPI00285D0748|nr:Lar family restriction alleviation protein [Caballeronia sp. LZ043]MDR5821956.1 Lar family restriction alleviation protein [Caballeronia sp. LZ043]